MTDTFETPLPPPPPPSEKDRKRTTIIIAVVAGVVVICCCIIVLGVVLWNYGDQIFGLAAAPMRVLL